jgi:hypothetical protein
VPLLGAVLHTLNMRLFSAQLEFVIRDGGDRFIFVDASLVPVLQQLSGKLEVSSPSNPSAAIFRMQVGSMGIAESDVILPAVPMFHANCWGLPYAAGMSGAKLVMLDRLPRVRRMLCGGSAIPENLMRGLDELGISTAARLGHDGDLWRPASPCRGTVKPLARSTCAVRGLRVVTTMAPIRTCMTSDGWLRTGDVAKVSQVRQEGIARKRGTTRHRLAG